MCGRGAASYGDCRTLHGNQASGARAWSLAVAAVSAAIAAISEKAELRIIRDPRFGSTRAQLAFDDAFRAQTVLAIAKLPAVMPLMGHRAHLPAADSGPVDVVVRAAGLLSSMAGIGAFFIMSLPWAGRHFHRMLPRPEPPEAPQAASA